MPSYTNIRVRKATRRRLEDIAGDRSMDVVITDLLDEAQSQTHLLLLREGLGGLQYSREELEDACDTTGPIETARRALREINSVVRARLEYATNEARTEEALLLFVGVCRIIVDMGYDMNWPQVCEIFESDFGDDGTAALLSWESFHKRTGGSPYTTDFPIVQIDHSPLDVHLQDKRKPDQPAAGDATADDGTPQR